MDKEMAIRLRRVIENPEIASREELEFLFEEAEKREGFWNQLEDEIEETLNPPEPKKDSEGMPPRICEWPK